MLHFGRRGEGPVLQPGMFFTIEPMVNAGRPEVKVLDDGWTAVTRDRSLSAQFEHMIGVTEDGVEVFTYSPAGLHKPPYGDGLTQPAVAPQLFVTTQKLRFCDTDRLGHVNNAVYAVMCEAGRVRAHAVRPGCSAPAAGHGVVIARLELDFLREMNWPGEVRIETAIHRIGQKSIQVRQQLHQDGVLVARATSILAVIDTAKRRAVPISDAMAGARWSAGWCRSSDALFAPD